MRRYFIRPFLSGLITLLPVGGVVLVLFELERALRAPLRDLPFYFAGLGILAAVVAVYLLGVVVSTFLGRWILRIVDRVLSRIPGLAAFYQTLKQILGYGTGKDALFQRTVWVPHETGALELGLVTGETTIQGAGAKLVVFVPGSPNPTSGRLLFIAPERCVPTDMPVDATLKALVSTGLSGLR